MEDTGERPKNIIIVGVCGSGKTTLADSLTALGYNAHTCAQEHSYVPYLWKRRDPDCLICLDAAAETVRHRLDVTWSDIYLSDERKRLANAQDNCYIYVNTDHLTAQEVLDIVLRAVEDWLDRSQGEQGPQDGD
ncbi:MAG: hypothetical protein M1319_03540 [Chloroflexi bacterium]|nr:hypothetical protein [Chloroflexota bacterium]